LGEEPVGRLGVLVPLGPMRILHHALSKMTCADRRLPCHTRNPDNERQEETRLKVIQLALNLQS
jgi:hypothetical protein